MKNNPDEIWVSCAIIEHEGKVLAARRNRNTHNAGKWEFPGGKIEHGETASQCLIREIEEELSVPVKIIKALPQVLHTYPDKTIRLFPFVCNYPGTTIMAKEHQQTLWFHPEELKQLDWSAADIEVWKYYLASYLGR